MRRTEGPSFTIGPDMIGIERITQEKEYRFIRLEDRFGFEEILPHVPRQHKNLAKSTRACAGMGR